MKARPVRLLVIQLARLGDTLQSLMALRAAQQLYPELEIHFVCRARFAGAAARVSWIKNVITLPTDELFGPILEGRKSEGALVPELARWIAPLAEQRWDYVVNWTYSDASSFLTALLPARVKLGYTRRKDGKIACADGWTHYVQAIVQGGVEQNIHLTDILTTQLLTALQIHLGESAADGNAAVTSKSFFNLELGERDSAWAGGGGTSEPNKKWIAIQLGAAQEAKSWDPSNWARLARTILKRHPEINLVLLGGREDQARASAFLASLRADPAIDPRATLSLVGETDFDLWASVVGRCQWLFSGDTAAIHLASVLGTRVLNVSTGPVRFAETGPYGNGHYVIRSSRPCKACEKHETEASQHGCRDLITPEAAYATWSYASSEWSHRRKTPLETHFRNLGWSTHARSIHVHRSRIRSTADGGGVFYEPLLSHPMTLADWNSMVMGHVARAWYCGWTPQIGQELSREAVDPGLLQSIRELDEESGVLETLLEQAEQTALALKDKSSLLKSNKVMHVRDRQQIQELGVRMSEIEGLLDRLATTQPALRSFSQMAQVMMHNLRGDDLRDLGEETAISYKQLREGAVILRDWIRHTLKLAKPIALTTRPDAPSARVVPLLPSE